MSPNNAHTHIHTYKGGSAIYKSKNITKSTDNFPQIQF